MTKEISRTVMAVRQAQFSGEVETGYLPSIIESLEQIRERVDAPKSERARLAGGLGRIVTDDDEFANSKLGLQILCMLNDFINYDNA